MEVAQDCHIEQCLRTGPWCAGTPLSVVAPPGGSLWYQDSFGGRQESVNDRVCIELCDWSRGGQLTNGPAKDKRGRVRDERKEKIRLPCLSR